MAGPSLWKVSSARARRFGSGFPLTEPRVWLLPHRHQLPLPEMFDRRTGCLLSQSATEVGVASVAILIRSWRISCLGFLHFKEISSKLAQFLSPTLPPGRWSGLHRLCIVYNQLATRAGRIGGNSCCRGWHRKRSLLWFSLPKMIGRCEVSSATSCVIWGCLSGKRLMGTRPCEWCSMFALHCCLLY